MPLWVLLLCSVLGTARGAALAVRFVQEGGRSLVNIVEVEVYTMGNHPFVVSPVSHNMVRLDGVEPRAIETLVLLFHTGQIVHHLTSEEIDRLVDLRCLTIKYDSQRIYQPAQYRPSLFNFLPRCAIV